VSDEDSRTVRTLYVIQTTGTVPELSASEIDRVIAQDGDADGATRLLAQVNLGEESLSLNGDGTDGSPFTQTISNFINDAPKIATNFYWASIEEHDGGDATDDAGPTARVGFTQSPVTSNTSTGGGLASEDGTPTVEGIGGTDGAVDLATDNTSNEGLTLAQIAQKELESANDLLQDAKDDLKGLDILGFNNLNLNPFSFRL